MLQHETWPIDKLIEYARNPRKNDHAVDRVAAAIREFGFRVPVVAKSDGTVVDGHLRLKAAKKLGLTEVPVVLADDMTDLQIKAFRLSVNKMAELAQWDEDMLKIELEELSELGFDLELTGFTDEEILALGDGELTDDDEPGEPAEPKGNLSDRFMIPPFTVLNAREGWWQNRKRAWLAIGIKSELGRGGGAGTPPHPPTVTKNRDGTLNYSGTAGQDARFDRQRQAAAPGQRATTAKSSATTARGGR